MGFCLQVEYIINNIYMHVHRVDVCVRLYVNVHRVCLLVCTCSVYADVYVYWLRVCVCVLANVYVKFSVYVPLDTRQASAQLGRSQQLPQIKSFSVPACYMILLIPKGHGAMVISCGLLSQ